MLINDVAALKAQIGGIQKMMTWPTWEPAVRQAEQKYIIPAIGQDFYNELIAIEVLSDEEKPLLDRLRAATAFFAYLENLPFLMTATGDAGLVVNTPGNTAVLTKWMYVAVIKDVAAKSDFWLEDALAWLESHAALYPTWSESDFYTVNYGRLIPSATAWTKVFPAAKNSRRLFLSVRQNIFNAEAEFIRPILGDDFYEALMGRLGNASMTFTAKEVRVLELCRKACANYGFAQAVPFLNMNADFRIVSETDGIVNEDELDPNRLNIVLQTCKVDAHNAGGELTKYLNKNASSLVFPEYYTSDQYRPAVVGGSSGLNDNSSNTYFVL